MERRVSGKQILFFISYGLYALMMVFRTTFFYKYFRGTGYKIIVALCVVLIIIAELLVGIGKRRFLIALAIAFAAFGIPIIFSGITGYIEFITLLIFIFSARDIPFRRIAKFTVIIMTALLVITIVSSQLGIIQDYISDDSRERHYLGFGYALFPSTISLNLTMLWVYIRKKAIHWFELVIVFVADLWIFMKTDSRLSFYLSVLVLIAGAFLKIFPNFLVRKKVFKYALSLCFIVFASLSLYMSYNLDMSKGWHSKLNAVLSDRLVLQNKAVEEYGFSWFGQSMDVNGNGLDYEGKPVFDEEETDYFYIDNLYISWYISNGFVFFILIIGACTLFIFKSIKYDKYGYLWLMLFILSLFCLIQDSFLGLYYNTFLLAAGNVLFNKKTEEELEITEKNY